MKTVIKTLAIAGVGHIIILNTGVAMSIIARKEKVQNTKIGRKLYNAMNVIGASAFAYGVMVDPENDQDAVNDFYNDYLTVIIEKLNN